MANPFAVLIYLDENLVRNLSSLVLSGYIETRIQRKIKDSTIHTGVHVDSRNGSSKQETNGTLEREGYRDENEGNIINAEQHNQISRDLDGKAFIRQEDELRRTYTTFALNGSLNNYLTEGQFLQTRNGNNIISDEIASGELIEIEGLITNQSLLSYIDTLIILLSSLGCDNLNLLLDSKKSKILNFSVLLNMLTHLQEILKLNDTQDLVMSTGEGSAVITVNKNNFMHSDYNIFDRVNCNCKVIGKVVKSCSRSGCISFLRKTGTEDFYEKFLESCDFLIECLKENGIVVPERPCCKIEENGIQIMPISISI
ncbi:hypothetical protein [Clostridium weizhouense]|uniref:Uncharacterized protein n=1 Tax=Clostridium weizhouense TaxID=2859781 RepID=A0ABS7AKV1_9CLOT|nr:hypothetical protein [Clostridium weizhouense]MBW6409189.1 hypothetical protein [Clostridium weizhouense]